MNNQNVVIGGKYRPFKGNLYQVIGIARDSETLTRVVVYRALYGDHEMYVRPLYMWNEIVEINGKMVPRFALESE